MDSKAFGAVSVSLKALDPDDEQGMFEAILSAPTLDRDGEVIDSKAFEPLPDHITIDVDHGMSTDTTVGSGVPFYDGDLLKFRGTFSSLPRAQDIRTLVMEGHIRKMSVAFMNAKREEDEEDGKVHIRRAELLNAAIVPIPSNREASILSAKAGALSMAACPKCSAESPANVKPEDAAAPAPASPPPDRSGIKALATLAEAELALIGVSTPPNQEN
jgi:hypothetical protein